MPVETPANSRRQPTPLGRLIARRLSDLDISQVDLAKRLHVSQTYISHIISGSKVPGVRAPGFIERWAAALEISPEELIAEGDLARYNVVPPGPDDLSAADRAILAAVSHLPQSARSRVATALRALFPPAVALPPEYEALVITAFRDASPDQGEEAARAFRALLRRSSAAGSDAPHDTQARPQRKARPSPAGAPVRSDSQDKD